MSDSDHQNPVVIYKMSGIYNKRVIAKHDHKVAAVKYFMEKSTSPCLYIYGEGATGKSLTIAECVEKDILHPKATHQLEKHSINIPLNPKFKRVFVDNREPPAFMLNNSYFMIYEFKADIVGRNTIRVPEDSDSE